MFVCVCVFADDDESVSMRREREREVLSKSRKFLKQIRRRAFLETLPKHFNIRIDPKLFLILKVSPYLLNFVFNIQ